MNKTQYNYLKHSAKGQDWQKHGYTSKKILPNGSVKYYYDNEPKGGKNDSSENLSLEELLGKTKKKVNTIGNNAYSNALAKADKNPKIQIVKQDLEPLLDIKNEEEQAIQAFNILKNKWFRLSKEEQIEILNMDAIKEDNIERFVYNMLETNDKSIEYAECAVLIRYAKPLVENAVDEYTDGKGMKLINKAVKTENKLKKKAIRDINSLKKTASAANEKISQLTDKLGPKAAPVSQRAKLKRQETWRNDSSKTIRKKK